MCSLHSLITNRKKFKADPEKNIKNKKRNPVYVFFIILPPVCPIVEKLRDGKNRCTRYLA